MEALYLEKTVAEQRKEADTVFAETIQTIIDREKYLSPSSAIAEKFTLALQLASAEQARQADSARPEKDVQSLRSIFAECLFGEQGLAKDLGLSPTQLDREVTAQIRADILAALLKVSREDEAKAKEEAGEDALTGLPNRRNFEATLDTWLSFNGVEGRKEDREREFALVIIDLDNFKNYNDAYGHSFGDLVLKVFSTVLRRHFRTDCGDLVFRWAGDEFIVVLQTNRENVSNILNRLWKKLQETLIEQPVHLKVTGSIGWSMHLPGVIETRQELFDRADKAIYQAKEAGRNTVVEFTEGTIGEETEKV